MQCVSLDSDSFVINPEIKATEVKVSALKNLIFCSYYFRRTKQNWGNPKKHTV